MARKSKTVKQNEAQVEQPKKDYSWLRKFQPGQSGNPNGRPVGLITLAKEIRVIGEETIDESGLTYLHALLRKMFQEAIDGDKETRQELFDRGWGTLLQKNMIVGLTGEIARFAKELGLDADDLEGSDTVRGLLEVATDNAQGFNGVEVNRGSEAGTATIEGSPAKASHH